MMTMTQEQAVTRIASALADWRSVGDVARTLGISRATVDREVRRMADEGRLESRVQRFWRNGDWRTGRAYRAAEPIECRPARSFREEVQAIIDEEWQHVPEFLRPTIASASETTVSVVFRHGWDDYSTVAEARRYLRHQAQLDREAR